MIGRLVSSVPVFVAVLCLTSSAGAHVRWFVEDTEVHADQHYTADSATVLVTMGAVLFIALAFAVDRVSRRWKTHETFEMVFGLRGGVEWRIIAALSGFMLVAYATMGIFLAPNLSLPGDGLVLLGRVGQTVLGLLLMSQVSFALSGILIVAFSALAIVYVPLELVIDYIAEFTALALSLFFLGPTMCPLDRHVARRFGIDSNRFALLPLPIIRIGLGLTLVILSVHNKLMSPALSLAFLDEYQYNFMPYLGFSDFTNLHFAYAAGVAELTLGLLLVSGVATRFAATVLAAFFFTTLFTIGSMELIGHAPLFGILLLLILQGSGSLKKALIAATDLGA